MKAKRFLQVALATLLAGGTMTGIGCGELASQSIKDGLVNYFVGSVSSSFDPALFGDLVSNLLGGSFMGTRSGT